jgi:UDP:flavonoid glycosyltransferase YjiC (YdhE family)
MLGFSPAVVHPPRDWPPDVRVTGYWICEEPPGWKPPDGLTAFLDSGPAPVYIGFGSMPDAEVCKTTRMVVDALRIAGARGVLLGGWSGLGGESLPETVIRVDSIPHAWLFPLTAAVVHHGGAGTTAAGLRAGVPSILLPYAADQYFWAKRVEKLGVGPKSVSYHRLSTEKLAGKIKQAVSDGEMRKRAAAFGIRIASEDGVSTAVKWISEFLGRK